MRFIACAALLCALPVHADLVARDKDAGAEMRLMDSQCSHAGTLALLKDEWKGKFKNARLYVKGNLSGYGCWIEQEGMAIVLMEDGSFIPVPMAAFSDPTI